MEVAESALWVVRRLFCNEVDAGNFTVAIHEEFAFAEAVVTRGESYSTLELVVSSIGIAEVDQRSILKFFILPDGVTEVNFELLFSNIDIVFKIQLHVVGASDGSEIEKSEVLVH